MQYTGLQVFSFLILLIGTGLIVVSIATNYWSYFNYQIDSKIIPVEGFSFDTGRRGLYEQCYYKFKFDSNVLPGQSDAKIETEFCQNRYEALLNDIQEKALKEVHIKHVAWEIACLAAMCGSALLGIFMLVLSPCCCTRCGCCLAVWVLIAALEAMGGIAVYVYYQETGQVTSVPESSAGLVTIQPLRYGYSFWCAVAGAACQLFASIFFAISRARTHNYSHTI